MRFHNGSEKEKGIYIWELIGLCRVLCVEFRAAVNLTRAPAPALLFDLT